MRRLMIVVLATLAAAFGSSPALAATGDSASGSGTTSASSENGSSAFSFAATGGTGSGGGGASGTMSFESAPTSIQADVRCLFVSGNEAAIVGLITASTVPPPGAGAVGNHMVFQVQDNGTPGAGQDLFVATFGQASETSCQSLRLGSPIETGEITVVQAIGQPATLTLSPKTATNTVGEQHCVTATVTDAAGNPTAGVTVVFSETGSVSTSGGLVSEGASGSAQTNNQGQATFCYTSDLPGENVIRAFADTNGNGSQDAGEPTDAATKTYVVPASTPGCTETVTGGGNFTALDGDPATFGGNAQVSADGTTSGQEQYQDHGPLLPLDVKSIEIQAMICTPERVHATIFGTATIDGAGSYTFRIEATDLGDPGSNDTYSILLSNGYYSGQQRLEGGNIQIH
jgi:hypothetical protein